MGQAETTLEQQDINELLDNVTGDQVVAEVMGVTEKTKALKVTFAQLRKAKNTAEIDRLLRRAPVVDIPDIIEDFAQRVTGAFIAVFRQLENLEALVDEGYEYDDMPGQAVSLAEAREKLMKLQLVVNYVLALAEGDKVEVPEDIAAAARDVADELSESEQELTAAEQAQQQAEAGAEAGAGVPPLEEDMGVPVVEEDMGVPVEPAPEATAPAAEPEPEPEPEK